MPEQELDIRIKADRQAASAASDALRNHQKDIQETIKGYRQMAQEARKLREVGTVLAATGVAILAPFIASASEYAKRYGALEKTSRDFLAAQQRSADATSSLGRVAAQSLTPIMNQVAEFQEKVAAFASAHPELVQAAVGVGGALVAGGGALVAAGTAITAIARSAELLKATLGGGGAAGLAGSVGSAVVGIGALAAGAKLGEAAVQAFGKATGDARLEAFTLADALKSVRQLIAIAAVAIAQMFIDAKVTLGRIGDIFGGVGALIKDKFESTLDTFATGFRIMLESLKDGVGKFINGILDAAAALAIKLNQPQLAEQIMGGINNDAVPDQYGKTQYQHNIDTEVRDLHARQYGRDQALAGHYDPLTGKYTPGAGSQMATNEAGRQQQYQTDQGNVGKIATFAGNFANTGSLGPLVDGVLKGIGDKIQGVLSGFNSKGGGVSTGGVAGLPPEAVNAFIEYRKSLAASEKQYGTERANITREYQNNEKKAARDHADEMLRIQQEQQQAESDLALKHQQDQDKAQSDFNFNEGELAKRATFERLQKERALQFQLTDLAAARDVAGFVQAQKAHIFETAQQKTQDAFDAGQRKEQFDQQTKDRNTQYAQDLTALKKQGEIKREQAEKQFANEERDRKTAYQQQLDALRVKHDQEKTLLEQHFAEQLASLNDNVVGLKNIHDAYYAQATADAQAFVNNNKAILAQLYGQTLGLSGGSTADSAQRAQLMQSTDYTSAFTASPSIMNQLANLPSFDVGGRIPRDMIIKAHKDEVIFNPHRGQVPGGGFTLNGDIHIGAGNSITRTEVHEAFGEFGNMIIRQLNPAGAG